jgi:hypothetical protein
VNSGALTKGKSMALNGLKRFEIKLQNICQFSTLKPKIARFYLHHMLKKIMH